MSAKEKQAMQRGILFSSASMRQTFGVSPTESAESMSLSAAQPRERSTPGLRANINTGTRKRCGHTDYSGG